MKTETIVRYLDQTREIPCPYGNVRRIVTGGEGTANVHVVRVTQGEEHFHQSYDEVYYFLAGDGKLVLDGKEHPVRPGAVAVIPAGCPHSLISYSKDPLEFIIFGTPPMEMGDERAKPRKPGSIG